MEVDLLRPGTVPMSTETVLWFEFLLHQDLLLKHLQKPSSDPTPTELITKFYDVISETIRNRTETDNGEVVTNVESNAHPAKNIALKILSIKVGAFLKWNIGELKSLPFKTQISLLQDLMYFTNDNSTIEIPNVEQPDTTTASPQFLFALVVFHRWLLNTSMHRITSNWQLRFGLNDMTQIDESIICSPENVQKTISFLKEALTWNIIPNMLTFDCFKLPTETNDNIEFNWIKGQPISKGEFVAQINYDLGTYFFYKEEYELAKQHFSQCLQSFNINTEMKGFCDFDKDILDVYVRACSGPVSAHRNNLLEQLNASIFKQYMGITTILQQDNIYREIPLIHRLNLELDIQGALSSGAFTVARDLLYKIKALNVVRCVLDAKPLYQYSAATDLKTTNLLWAIQVTWSLFTQQDKSRLKRYLLELVLKKDAPDLLPKLQASETFENLFDKTDFQYMKDHEDNIEIPESLNKTEFSLFDVSKKRKPQMELQQLTQQLISSYDYKEIGELLVKITKTNLEFSVWKINPQWELSIPLQSVLKSLPRGFLQDFAYIMLAKSKEQMLNKNWNSSGTLLRVLDKELQAGNGNISKLSRLVNWEILLVQITEFLTDWPLNSVDRNQLANDCEECLQINDTVLPRTEITEQCVVCLLNLGRWEFLITFDKRWCTFEVAAAIALTCQEIVSSKGSKKLSKNLWDLVLRVFISLPSQSRRNNSGSSYHEVATMKVNLMAVFSKLRDPMTLTVVISLLTKLFNILNDDEKTELQGEYITLWPAVVSNASSYNSLSVCELLSEIVTQALKSTPTNVAWLRLMGDINFANGHYRISLSYYLKSLLIFTDYFNIPVRNDDHVFKRMITCCTVLGCHTQAAVLCQFLEKPGYIVKEQQQQQQDYSAFRILGEQKTCNDAVDAYYHCFWDTNILEYLIFMHNKKGERERRKCAIQVIGLLELNSNNNEEIQREASNLRKSTFLRALCKQYVF